MAEVYYGISLPEGDEVDSSKVELKPFYTDKTEVMKVLKEVKTGRFKVFKSQEEAEQFSRTLSSIPIAPPSSLLSSPKPSEKCEFKSLKPQEEVKFRKAIESRPSDLEFIQSCIEENARYLVTPSDTPTILQQGQRTNALHVAARHGKVEAAKVVLSHVTGDLMMRMYPEEDSGQNNVRREHLVDMYLNMPDKGGGDTPLHLAAKFGHLDMVRLLCSYPQTRLEQTNKFGEVASQVVGSRAKEQEHLEEMKEILGGQVVIPVFSQDDAKSLGKPISLREASELLETSLNTSDASQVSSPSSLSPMLAGRSSPRMARRGSSPLVQSTRARVSSSPHVSPLVSRTGNGNSPSVKSLSAVMGPLPSSQAKSLYRKWKTGECPLDNMARQRLEDPQLGVERQGRALASKEGVSWIEFWPWLGDYFDMASDEGLGVLEHYLEEKTRQLRDKMDREYQDDIEDEFEASLANDEDVFSGELEIVSQGSRLQKASSTPAKVSSLTDFKASPWTAYRSSSEDDHDQSLDNSDHVFNTTDKNGNMTEPLSPLSCLTNGMTSMNLTHDDSRPGDISSMSIVTTPVTEKSGGNEVTRLLEQFAATFVSLVADNVGECDQGWSDTDWVTPLAAHWSVVRRQVNNWRSDPLGRWSSLDWGRVGVTLVTMMCDQVSLELGDMDRERLGQCLASVVDITKKNHDQEQDEESYGQGRRRHHSTSQVVGVKDVARLCSMVSKCLLDPRLLLIPSQCADLWNLDTAKQCVATDNVNRARRFLHSSTSSDRSNDNRQWSEWSNDVTRADNGIINSDRVDTHGDTRRLSGSSVSTVESWVTPPCSPGASSVASMETCSEGIQVWVCGDQPTVQDRRVAEALSDVSQDILTRYPHVSWYLAHVSSYSRDQQLSWPGQSQPPDKLYNGLARRLDLDFTI